MKNQSNQSCNMKTNKLQVREIERRRSIYSRRIAGVRAPLFGVFAPFVRGVLVPLVLTRPASVAKLLKMLSGSASRF